MKVKKVVCAKCGSEDVQLDAWATWNVKTQQYDVDIMDKGHCCNGKCQGICKIKIIEVEFDPSVLH